MQLKQFTRAHLLRNERHASVFVYKVGMNMIGRMQDLFANSGDFPQISGHDAVILHKADVRLPSGDPRAHNAEALVGFYVFCF